MNVELAVVRLRDHSRRFKAEGFSACPMNDLEGLWRCTGMFELLRRRFSPSVYMGFLCWALHNNALGGLQIYILFFLNKQ